MVEKEIVMAWTNEQMDEYAKVLELQEALVLRAYYEEKLNSFQEVEEWVSQHIQSEYDRDYVSSIYTLVAYPDRKVSLVD
jgi:hypothetical protein